MNPNHTLFHRLKPTPLSGGIVLFAALFVMPFATDSLAPRAQAASGQAASAAAAAANPKTVVAPVGTTNVAAKTAAKVVFVEGDAMVFAAGGKRRAAVLADAVLVGEAIETKADGEVHLEMGDGGYISIRPNTKMRITKFDADGTENDSSVIGLLQGSLRTITGWIGKYNTSKALIRTPSATIGIRGTDHEPLVIPKDAKDAEGEAGTYDKVNAGGSFIRTPQGRVDVGVNQAAFAGHNALAPRLLKETPKFYRPTRNEKLLEGKHDQVQQRVAERRQNRQAELKAQAEEREKEREQAQQKRKAETEQREQRQQQLQQQRKQQAEQAKAEKKAAAEKRAADKKLAQQEAADKKAEKARHDKRPHNPN